MKETQKWPDQPLLLTTQYLTQFNGKIEISDYFLYFQLKSALFSLEHSLPFHNVMSVVDAENNF